jgi:hypothetical protein
MALAGDFAGNRAGSFFVTLVPDEGVAFFAAVVLPARRDRTRDSDVLKVKSTSSMERARNGAAAV